MRLRFRCLCALLLLASCGNNLSKGKLPTNNSPVTNNATNNTTTGLTNSTNAGPNNTTGPTNGTTGTAGTTGPTNNSTTTTNNTTTSTTNTTGPDASVAFIAGESARFGTTLDANQVDYDLVGSDNPQTIRDLETFFVNDLAGYDTLVVDNGQHMSNLESTNADMNAVLGAARVWLENGGRLVDLSGGVTGRLYPNFAAFQAIVAPGSYIGTTYSPLATRSLEFSPPARSMIVVDAMTVSGDGETLLADAAVQGCEISDINCASPTERTTVLIASKTVGQGIIYLTLLVPPLTMSANGVLLQLLTL